MKFGDGEYISEKSLWRVRQIEAEPGFALRCAQYRYEYVRRAMILFPAEGVKPNRRLLELAAERVPKEVFSAMLLFSEMVRDGFKDKEAFAQMAAQEGMNFITAMYKLYLSFLELGPHQ